MNNNYQTPVIEIIDFENNDIITASGPGKNYGQNGDKGSVNGGDLILP
ncbi:MAG: hypothetical protein IJ194_07825 [Bacilli bacterium]|nr:hypothetical protein [Bacilli bacterium]